MVKHVILWQLKDELLGASKEEVKKGIKEGLESLAGKIPGLVEIEVYTDTLESSNVDVMLYSVFTDAASLKNYATHPLHVEIADSKVRPYTKTRNCIDVNC